MTVKIKINSIDFSILSPRMIKKMATLKVVKQNLYDQDGYAVEDGVMDPRLGVIDPGMRCRVCGGTVGDCPGHFGCIELARPVIHIEFAKIIYQILKGTCSSCGRILASPEEIEKKLSLKKIAAMQKKQCPYCGENREKVKFEKPYTFFMGKDVLNALQIREWFERITEDDLKTMKFKGGRPEWLLLTLVPVPPVTMRPSITLETGERSEDDLTHKLVDIIRINQRLKDNMDIGAPDFIIEDLWELLQYHVATLFNNELSKIPQARHRSGRALKGLSQRLKGKEGRFRGNLIGKRVNFSARTVISPDPKLSINEVGVPLEIAKELTVPIRANEMNKEDLKKLILRGNNWPGANYLVRPDGRKKRITAENAELISEEVEQGYVVERHLIDGDIVLFNRQPTLHKMSLMAHRVKVMPWKTFRLNLSVCPPYNADFDGDEMNLHVPQTEEARAEAELLMDVKHQIRSPRFGGPIIGAQKDHISGSYILTKKGFELPKEKASYLLGLAGIDADLPDKGIVTGKEIFSAFLPDDLDFECRSASCVNCDKCIKEKCPHDAFVKIDKGQLKCGIIDKNSIGAFKGKLLDTIERDYGSDITKDFIDNVTKVSLTTLLVSGVSIGVSETDIPDEAKKKIEKELVKAEKESNDMIIQYRKGEIKTTGGQTEEEMLENMIKKRLADSLNSVSGILKSYIKPSFLTVMADSGARGSMINITQIAGAVGQETILGERVHRGYYERILPHFKKGDLSAVAHGFVVHGFKEGLTPFEFFFDTMNGREGLMDKSLRTRHSGYMERRLVNALQDLKVEYDNTIRDNRGVIIQFFPGEDGIDPSKSDGGKINLR